MMLHISYSRVILNSSSFLALWERKLRWKSGIRYPGKSFFPSRMAWLKCIWGAMSEPDSQEEEAWNFVLRMCYKYHRHLYVIRLSHIYGAATQFSDCFRVTIGHGFGWTLSPGKIQTSSLSEWWMRSRVPFCSLSPLEAVLLTSPLGSFLCGFSKPCPNNWLLPQLDSSQGLESPQRSQKFCFHLVLPEHWAMRESMNSFLFSCNIHFTPEYPGVHTETTVLITEPPCDPELILMLNHRNISLKCLF